ncbi:16S rRNA (cytosine(1402)-N(4))-methyltransferase RsmH [Allochromatium palmeri]|uniref:Ribosomal RNA small subunit methyltransferase H n=1 Tax=Allochromatium palmeri TaxID=231048 RepID=A0A6N8EGL9_9GAMM|nr:16S rRNA (cytosine(1402)-N(4))-methyltransferase RsmH [Allochromatium palmeri]MTW22009.1 16S rRNA (cytosine(1402)-N(4))-methyltransferase RsmH [Allochromatium palmeri]
MSHKPVLLEETVSALLVQPDGIYVDGTFGRGGHSRAILSRLGASGRLLGLDRDPEAVAVGQALAAEDSRFSIHRGSFGDLGRLLAEAGLESRLNGLLLDLGVSSPQLDQPERGFSFMADGPLDMRMDPDSGESAAQWLARADQSEIATVLREFGEERFANRIARAIVETRVQSPIRSTAQLAELVARAVPRREPGKHPATRTFQALRIQVNGELEALHDCLDQVVDRLAIGGRLVVISFHSLEDRPVKRFIRRESKGPELPKGVPARAVDVQGRLRPIGKSVRPSAAEETQNPRARSAIMRVAERLP